MSNLLNECNMSISKVGPVLAYDRCSKSTEDGLSPMVALTIITLAFL